jgi:fused signal recognition particle receptor
MRELGKIHKRRGRSSLPEGAPHETLLVLDATIGQNAINQAKTFAEVTNVTGLFLAKLDGSCQGRHRRRHPRPARHSGEVRRARGRASS